MNLNDKYVPITGRSIVIGRQLAKKINNEEANVLICARNPESPEKAKKESPPLGIAQCHVTNLDQLHVLSNRVKQLFGGIDIQLNNADVFRRLNRKERWPQYFRHYGGFLNGGSYYFLFFPVP